MAGAAGHHFGRLAWLKGGKFATSMLPLFLVLDGISVPGFICPVKKLKTKNKKKEEKGKERN